MEEIVKLGLKLDLLLVFIKSCIGFVAVSFSINIIPISVIFYKNRKIPSSLSLSIFIYTILAFVYMFFFAFLSGRTISPNLHQVPVSILIAAISITTWSYFFDIFSSQYIQSIFYFTIFSHFIYYTPVIYDSKKDSDAVLKRIVAESQKEDVSSIDLREFWIDTTASPLLYHTILRNWLYHTGLVDSDIKLIVEDPPNQ